MRLIIVRYALSISGTSVPRQNRWVAVRSWLRLGRCFTLSFGPVSLVGRSWTKLILPSTAVQIQLWGSEQLFTREDDDGLSWLRWHWSLLLLCSACIYQLFTGRTLKMRRRKDDLTVYCKSIKYKYSLSLISFHTDEVCPGSCFDWVSESLSGPAVLCSSSGSSNNLWTTSCWQNQINCDSVP